MVSSRSLGRGTQEAAGPGDVYSQFVAVREKRGGVVENFRRCLHVKGGKTRQKRRMIS